MADISLAQEVFPFSFSKVPDQTTQESGLNVEHYLSLGDALALQGNIAKALDAYCHAFSSVCVPPHRLSTFVSILIERSKANFELAEVAIDTTNLSTILTCRCCGSHWADPLTLKCGHTFCRACVEHSLDDCGCGACIVCWSAVDKDYLAKGKTNILLLQVLLKCFADETAVYDLKVAGNRHAARNCFTEAIKDYTGAIEIAPTDVHLRNGRSLAFSAVGLCQNALEDADLIIQLRPEWTQGYCRKAAALRGLSQLEESTECYLQCLAMNPGSLLAKAELTKVLHEFFSQSSLASDSKVSERFATFMSHDGSRRLRATNLNSVSNSGPVGLSPTSGAYQGKCEKPRCVPGAADAPCPRRSCLSFLFPSKKMILKGGSCSGSNLFCRPSSLSEVTDHSAADSMSEITQSEKLSAEDFECSLCSSLLLCPVTTDCGHVFCCDCLYRSLDYRSVCPLCKESLVEFLAERRQATTESVELITKLCLYKELKKRRKQRKQELSLWSRNVDGEQLEIPVFVCTLAYPGIPCPLHVFEPRYRLMIRRCIESGLNQFGMCVCLSQSEENFAEFGTLLLIRHLQYLADGRSVIDTVGGRRFRVLSRGVLDGHRTAKVTYLSDEAVPSNEVEGLNCLQMEVHAMSSNWFACLPTSAQSRIVQCYGNFPPPEPEFAQQPDGPVWIWYMTTILPIGPHSQLKILSMLSLRNRLLAIYHILTCLHIKQSTS